MSKTSRIRDNNMYGTVANFLKDKIQDGASLSFVSAYFTINAFNALRDSLTGIDNLRFLYCGPNKRMHFTYLLAWFHRLVENRVSYPIYMLLR